ncbi:MAG: hypothetical protein MRJ96_12300 [Nitrospirales bacterium]|nr:hypothetical protein [Nitrospira sp.]MDR4502223.1 hypothetical protein [Nitrospirales bacterium]
MKGYYCAFCLCVLNISLPASSLAGDASLGMAAHGNIRVPQSGMVADMFGAPRMPNLGTLKKPYKTPMTRERRRQDISTTSKTPQPARSQSHQSKP